MDAPVSEPPNETLPLLQRINGLIATLAAQGLVIDIAQRLRLNELLLGLAMRQSIPDDPAALGRLITPILAGSPAQQAMCEAAFKSKLLDEPSPPEPLPDDNLNRKKESVARKSWGLQTWLSRGLICGIAALLVTGAIYLAFNWWRQPHIEVKNSTLTTSTTIDVMDIDWIKNYPKPKSSFSCQEVGCGSVSTWLPNFKIYCATLI